MTRIASTAAVLLALLLPAQAAPQVADEPSSAPSLSEVDDSMASTQPTLVRTSDSSVLRVRRLVTLVQVSEGYLSIEQVWVLRARDGYIYAPRPEDEGIRVTLPDGAEGVQVFQPVSGARQTDEGITLRPTVGPEGSIGTSGADLLVQFRLPNESATHWFEQTIPFPVETAFVFVHQETPYPSYPRLSVDLFVPSCEASVPDDVVCFATLGGETPAWEPYRHLDRRAAQGGTAAMHGARLVFGTEGWPTPFRGMRWVALTGSFATLVLGFLFWRRRDDRQTGEGSKRFRGALERERRRLIAELWKTSRLYQSGRLAESEYELQHLLLSHELEQVYHALGVEPDEPTEGESAAGKAPTSSGTKEMA